MLQPPRHISLRIDESILEIRLRDKQQQKSNVKVTGVNGGVEFVDRAQLARGEEDHNQNTTIRQKDDIHPELIIAAAQG